MSHSCFIKQKLRKGLWSPEEDEKLYNYITKFGVGCWSSVPILSGLQRCGKSCRLRWINYLRPDLKRGRFSQQEEDLIIRLHEFLGNRWAQIAAQLPGRTDNEIKNFWNSRLKKKLLKQGIDPNTHQPVTVKDEKEKKICTENASLQQPQTNGRSMEGSTVFDPVFLSEFETNIDSCGFNSSFYNQNKFDQMPNLTNLDQRNSRMSSDDRSEYQMINNMVQNGSISWDADQKYECQIDGIKIEEDQVKQISPWQERLIQTENSGDLSDYPLTSLSGEDLSGEILDNVFNHL